MRAMILAAGEGRRLRPLTLKTPKPLIHAGGKSLLEYHLLKLAEFGIRDLVINVHYLRGQIMRFVGKGDAFGLRVTFSEEEPLLNTGGGILKALPLLGGEPFLVVSSDVWTDFDLAQLPKSLPRRSAHLVMVDNPPHNPDGDYGLRDGRIVTAGEGRPLTYTGMALLDPGFLDKTRWPERFPLRDAFALALREKRLFGQRTEAAWVDTGTPERLAALRAHLDKSSAPQQL